MERSVVLVALAVMLWAGCLGPAGTEPGTSVTLELDQRSSDASPFDGDGENCLALTPEDNATMDVQAEAAWDTDAGPGHLWLALNEVEGGTTHAQASGAPGIQVQAEELDSRVNVAVTLADDADQPAENLTIELTYNVDGPLASAATATCEV